MKNVVNFTAAVAITGAVFIAWGVSAAANWYFGASLGTTEPFNIFFFTTTTSALFSWASLATDIIKALTLFLVFTALANKQYRETAALLAIWTLCTFWSFNSAVGFVALNHTTVVDNRGHTATNWQQLDKEIKRLEERRAWIPEHRPHETVAADLAGRETAYLYARTVGCTDVTVKGSRSFCDQVASLRRESANAKAAADLDKQLEDRRQEQKGAQKISAADPYAEMIGSLVGVAAANASSGRALFFAFMIEFISGVALWAVWSATAGRRREPQGASKEASATPIAAPVVTQAPEPPVAAESPIERPTPAKPHVVTENGKPVSKAERKRRQKERAEAESIAAIEQFTAECLDVRSPGAKLIRTPKGTVKGGGTPGADLRKSFRRWARTTSEWGHLAKLNDSHLGRAMTAVLDGGKDVKGAVYAALLLKEVGRVRVAA